MPTYTKKLVPGAPAPRLEAMTVAGRRWTLGESAAKMTLLIFYRGGFCSYCRTNLQDYQAHAADFAGRGVEVVFASADEEAQARSAADDWEVALPICHGVGIGQMEDWGLFLSAGDRAMRQPDVFCEPGLFLVGDGVLLYAVLNSAPFGRPRAGDMVAMLDFMESKGAAFPQRGGWHAQGAGLPRNEMLA